MLLLYEALARGPVTVVAPMVAAHPVLVIALAVLMGRDPAAGQWLAMAAILAGAVITVRCAEEPADGVAPIARSTLVISLAAAAAYAVMVSAGQASVPLIGDAPTAWWGRLTAIAVLLTYMAARRVRPARGRPGSVAIPSGGILLLLGAQAFLDGGGHLLLFFGSHGAHPEVAAVAASTFGAVTTLLAYVVLRERVTRPQWGGIAMIFLGVFVLSMAE
jgi:drug/metabolite transporter (DMT)-like permease